MMDTEATVEAVNGSALARFGALLGDDVFLVPCEWGTKKPLVTYVERPFEGTKTPAYRALFEVEPTNIAVYLGKASGGLCAIDFDADEDLAAFLAVNPKLAGTLRSRGSRGGMVWLRVQGDYPESCNPEHKRFEWRADRRLSTIYGLHPRGMEYSLVVEAAPVAVAFSEIVWPAGWELPWLNGGDGRLRQLYGEPFYTNEKGALTGINEAYWAGLHASENEILFEKDERAFYAYASDTGLYAVESDDSIRTKISGRMLEASRQANVFDLQKRRTAKTLNSVIAHLRGIVEQQTPFAERRKVIHLANGVIVFNGAEAELRPFSPEYRSRHRSPIAFDENAKCERFLNELVLPAVHPEDVELLQKFAGMFLLGYNRAQRLLILDGEAGRGKTQFANVMQGVVGMANVTQLRTKHLAERFELFRYLKRTLLVGVDVEADFLSTKGAAVLKGLVGGDWFDAEQKGGTGSFQLQGTFNVLITSNARLRVRLQGDVGAWGRRLNIVRYEAPPPARKINDFGAYLVRTEGSGILNWALMGAGMVLSEIPDEGGDLKLTQRQRGIVDSLLAESDSLRHFLQERVIADSYGDLTVTELVEGYGAYCPERKWQPLPITEVHNKLEGLMLELFGVTKRHDVKREDKNQRGFSGVKFLTEGDNS
ncbi:MAG TPA: bifunctional DNA primase/polymerase [Verrucomicrobiota bacterium]|jgi:phage/plasmid-associated DNA primase|nr:bifunctional DNA primase/polymerase [Verrucomicrobiota bacterium]HOH39767.1 bifunctional DNA primase/polymerase [Verrucomicrobiota bacterium]